MHNTSFSFICVLGKRLTRSLPSKIALIFNLLDGGTLNNSSWYFTLSNIIVISRWVCLSITKIRISWIILKQHFGCFTSTSLLFFYYQTWRINSLLTCDTHWTCCAMCCLLFKTISLHFFLPIISALSSSFRFQSIAFVICRSF